MTKQVEVKEKKAHVAKVKEGNYSLFSNLNPNVSADTQTVSNKKLMKPILHSIGLTLGYSEPVPNNSKNEKQFNKVLNKLGVSKMGYQLQHNFMASVSKQTVL
jgi:hypothetical protein